MKMQIKDMNNCGGSGCVCVWGGGGGEGGCEQRIEVIKKMQKKNGKGQA